MFSLFMLFPEVAESVTLEIHKILRLTPYRVTGNTFTRALIIRHRKVTGSCLSETIQFGRYVKWPMLALCPIEWG